MGVLRFILAISVVLSHTEPLFGIQIVGGQIAVQAFYIISGFYMSMILNEKYINKNSSYSLFITNRFLRLFPTYWTTLIITFLVALLLFFTIDENSGIIYRYIHYAKEFGFGNMLLLVFSNIFILGQDWLLFFGIDLETGHLFFTTNFKDTLPPLYKFQFIPQAWSIGTELTFYLIAPFLVRKKLNIIIPIILGSLLLRLYLYNSGLQHDPWLYRFFPTELVFFLFGNVSYRLYIKIKDTTIQPYILKFALAFVLLFSLFYDKFNVPFQIYIYYIIFFLSIPFIFKLTKSWKKDRLIGELSYPIYISHMLIIMIIRGFSISTKGYFSLVIIIGSIVFSILVNKFVADKIEIIRQKRIKR